MSRYFFYDNDEIPKQFDATVPQVFPATAPGNFTWIDDVRLLRRQLDIVAHLPKEYIFLNYLRCHDDIGWGLDYGFLAEQGIDEVAHKGYLNEFFLGNMGFSKSRGEKYNDDPTTGDARMCGTTASLCGIECAGFEGDEEAMSKAIDLDVMLHAYMLMQSGIPVIYSGDEIAQVNDYSYKNDPEKVDDSRYLLYWYYLIKEVCIDKRFDVTALGEQLIDFTINGESAQGNPIFVHYH